MKTRRVADGWRLPIVLSLLCLVLAAVLGVELVQKTQPVDIVEVAPPPPAPQVEAGELTYEPKPIGAFEEIVERPLFLSTRRPAPAEPGTETASQDASDGQFVVAGIVVGERRRLALVIAEGQEKPVRVEVGQSISGWTIEAIHPTRVVFRHGDTVAEVNLQDRITPAAEEKPPRAPLRPARLPTREPRAKPK